MRHTYNKPPAIAPDSDGRESRVHGRLRTERLTCKLGQIIDISAAGMRLRSKRSPGVKVGHPCQLTLRLDERQLVVTVTPVWVRRGGIRLYEAGFEFVNLTPSLSNEIAAIARAASLWTIRPIDRGSSASG